MEDITSLYKQHVEGQRHGPHGPHRYYIKFFVIVCSISLHLLCRWWYHNIVLLFLYYNSRRNKFGDMDKFCDSTMDKFEKYDKFGKPKPVSQWRKQITNWVDVKLFCYAFSFFFKEFDESTGCFSSMFSKLSFFNLAYTTSFFHSFNHIHSIIVPKLFIQNLSH